MASRIVSIVGRKNTGKTTLVVALVAEFVRRGRRVMTLKHGHHPAEVDRPGSDTWRHFHEGPAERTLIASPELRVLFERTPDDYDPIGLAKRYLAEADLVVAEGFSGARLPKVEVYRPSVASTPIYDATAANASDWRRPSSARGGSAAPSAPSMRMGRAWRMRSSSTARRRS